LKKVSWCEIDISPFYFPNHFVIKEMSMAYNPAATISAASRPAEQKKIRSVVFASAIGTIIEWYDFLIYGMAAALVFNKLFFPNIDPLVGTLAALGSYAVGFLARPLGGAIFGHYGDRIGRKSILMITLALMGIGTFLIGLLPTYAQIGIWAPILLVTLRIIQGIGLGGEWGGAAVMVLEHSPKNRRGFYGSLVQVGFPLGLVIATLVFSFVSKLPEEDIMSWGWRVPFLLSAVLIIVGVFIRKNVEESPVFEDMKARKELSKSRSWMSS
jgi:MHS family shikimate/dehydroshikimate transporter-like MFS transporter